MKKSFVSSLFYLQHFYRLRNVAISIFNNFIIEGLSELQASQDLFIPPLPQQFLQISFYPSIIIGPKIITQHLYLYPCLRVENESLLPSPVIIYQQQILRQIIVLFFLLHCFVLFSAKVERKLKVIAFKLHILRFIHKLLLIGLMNRPPENNLLHQRNVPLHPLLQGEKGSASVLP